MSDIFRPMNSRQIIITGLVLCILYVVIGAFGAHGLSSMIGDMGDTFNTGSEYHAFHAMGLIALGILGKIYDVDLKWAAYLLILGILLFSGSLYLMSVCKMKLGIITPIGGVGFIAGWVIAVFRLLK